MILGIWLHDNDKIIETEIHLALESANKANAIHPNTVSGFVFSQNDINANIDRAHQTLENLKKLKDEAAKLNLKVGTRQNCEGIKINRDSENTELTNVRKEIVEYSDFIICEVDPQTALGPSAAFAGVKTKLTKHKNELKGLNSKIEVMGQTGYSARFNLDHEVDDLMKYWKLCDGWAKENNLTFWMMEAFDNPWKNWDDKAANMGWWKLKDNSKTSSVDSYIEKIDILMENGNGGESTTVKYHEGSTTGKPISGGKQPVKQSKKNGAGKLENLMSNFILYLIGAVFHANLM